MKTILGIAPLLAIFLFVALDGRAQNGVLLPKGFPQYQNTGDQDADHARYQVQKESWIKTHPEEYAALKPAQNRTILDIKGYPAYQVSGDRESDDQKYDEAKQKWIQENPEEYRKLAGNPEEITQPNKEREQNTLEERKSEEARLKTLQPNR